MTILSLLSVGIGATLGAWLRWLLSTLLNPVLPALPLGTLAANLIGGYLIGLSIAVFEHNVHIPVETRLFIVAGFMGGLTTFSSFSAEVVLLMNQRQLAWALGTIAAHLGGSLAMTALGLWSFGLFVRSSI
ncbi:fluoride efflux transporter CrcB [Silvimonas amylolytica]|uniref:Fluoride-specific ion channel FluC n=1 Tax=Silvimonas amylolytica TaxID=449663 RepID=A0ABQ2PRM8_9NEIS|nr:fluoride efflux transporter CrcB [Silvimonas amylolytica]GGP27614.1 putative fluoride ion transporter CrcB [Silvimonas amylolytica]